MVPDVIYYEGCMQGIAVAQNLKTIMLVRYCEAATGFLDLAFRPSTFEINPYGQLL